MIPTKERCTAYRQRWASKPGTKRGGYWQRVGCRNRARWHVVAPQFDERLCGTHAGPWRRDQQWQTYRQAGSIEVTRLPDVPKKKPTRAQYEAAIGSTAPVRRGRT
jgi:hypothetical protein